MSWLISQIQSPTFRYVIWRRTASLPQGRPPIGCDVVHRNLVRSSMARTLPLFEVGLRKYRHVLRPMRSNDERIRSGSRLSPLDRQPMETPQAPMGGNKLRWEQTPMGTDSGVLLPTVVERCGQCRWACNDSVKRVSDISADLTGRRSIPSTPL